MAFETVVALDAGGATLKASVASVASSSVSASVVQLANHAATPVGGSSASLILGAELAELERRRSRLNYVRPIERGYCVNWNVEAELYGYLMGSNGLNVESSSSALVATAPPAAPTQVNDMMDQVVFEELGFQAFERVSGPEMCVLSYADHCRQSSSSNNNIKSPIKKRRKRAVDSNELSFATSSCHLVIDSGFSFTHVVPVIDGRAFLPGVKRLNVGGKLLTNYLKEVVSFRQWDVRDDTRVMDELKHALCYCALDFDAEMRRVHGDRRQRKRWALPDYVTSFEGRLLDDDAGLDDQQALEMGVEMVAVPEVLFHPSDIGIHQAGLAETVMQAVNACPVEYRGALLDNMLLVGGNTKFLHFATRLEQDLRPLAPDEYTISIHTPPDPILAAWEGCAAFVQSDACQSRLVTKQEYDEHGSSICHKRF